MSAIKPTFLALQTLRTALKGGATVKDGQIKLRRRTEDGLEETEASTLEAATHLRFSELSSCYDKLSRTNLLLADSSSAEQQHTLEQVLYTYLTASEPTEVYMRDALRFQGQNVPIMRRRAVVEYLSGTTKSLPGLQDLRSTTPPGSPTASARSHAPFGSAQSASKDPLEGAMTGKAQEGPTTNASAGFQGVSEELKRKLAPNATDLEYVKRVRADELVLKDRNSVLRGVKEINFSNVRRMVADRTGRKGGSLDPASDGQSGGTSLASSGRPLGSKKLRQSHPIIIIPSSKTSFLTMDNVKSFLEEAQFVSAEDARRAARGMAEDVIPIYRTRDGDNSYRSKYLVVDEPETLKKFGADAWDRVVCIVTTGQEWQFKQYKWSTPRDLFHHLKGFYFCYAQDPTNPSIKDWNVQTCQVDRTRRYTDKMTVAAFWRSLDQWTAIHKPYLRL